MVVCTAVSVVALTRNLNIRILSPHISMQSIMHSKTSHRPMAELAASLRNLSRSISKLLALRKQSSLAKHRSTTKITSPTIWLHNQARPWCMVDVIIARAINSRRLPLMHKMLCKPRNSLNMAPQQLHRKWATFNSYSASNSSSAHLICYKRIRRRVILTSCMSQGYQTEVTRRN